LIRKRPDGQRLCGASRKDVKTTQACYERARFTIGRFAEAIDCDLEKLVADSVQVKISRRAGDRTRRGLSTRAVPLSDVGSVGGSTRGGGIAW
jgi:hypothetical protein